MRPRLKPFARLAANREITLVREAGVVTTIPDPDGHVAALLEIADGTRTADELAAAMTVDRPALSRADVLDGIAALDREGLLEDADAGSSLSEWQRERYTSNLAFFGTFADLAHSRHGFQEALRSSHVLLLGVGGLGSTLLLNLAGLGVGRVTALDHDRIELKNLSRQFLYSEGEVGQPKLGRAVARARAFNSDVELRPVERRVSGPEDIAPLLPGVDLVLSGIDRPDEVHSWVNQACVATRVPFVTGGMQVSRGLYYSVDPRRGGCRACLAAGQQGTTAPLVFPDRVNRGIGPVASLMGALVALEAVRYLTGFAPPVALNRLWLVDFASGRLDVALEWHPDPECRVCGRGVPVRTSA